MPWSKPVGDARQNPYIEGQVAARHVSSLLDVVVELPRFLFAPGVWALERRHGEYMVAAQKLPNR